MGEGSLLDYGCGVGNTTDEIVRLGGRFDVTLADPDPECLRRASERLPDARRMHLDDAGRDGLVHDVVLLSHVLQYVSEPMPLLRPLVGRLRPGGFLVMATPNPVTPTKVSHHLRRRRYSEGMYAWDRHSMTDLVERGVGAQVTETATDFVLRLPGASRWEPVAGAGETLVRRYRCSGSRSSRSLSRSTALGSRLTSDPRQVAVAIIGFHKGGTTALLRMLAQHPDVCVHPGGQWPFFLQGEDYAERYPEVMEEQFGHAPPDARALVRDDSLSQDPVALARFAELNPDAVLVLSLRDPAERAYSAYWHAVERGFDSDVGFDEVLRRGVRYGPGAGGVHLTNYLGMGFYHRALAEIERVFPRRQLVLVRSKDLAGRPDGALSASLRRGGAACPSGEPGSREPGCDAALAADGQAPPARLCRQAGVARCTAARHAGTGSRAARLAQRQDLHVPADEQ